MGMVISQYEVYLINLDLTVGHENQKTRPCCVISPDEMNSSIQTIIIAPMTTKSHPYPSRINITFEGKQGWIVLDQLRTVYRKRLIKKLGRISDREIEEVKLTIQEMLVD